MSLSLRPKRVQPPGLAPAATATSRLNPVAFSCEALDEMGPYVVAATYWFRLDGHRLPADVTVRFTARPVGPAARREDLVRYERIDAVPGEDWVAVTSRFDVGARGHWQVSAEPANDPRLPGLPTGWANIPRISLPRASAGCEAVFAPVGRVRGPGARLGAWPLLVAIGVVLAFTVQALLAHHVHAGVLRTLVITASASLLGLVGAKAWFLVLHREHVRTILTAGMYIQGFVAVAGAGLVLGAYLAGLSIGQFLDLSAPAMLVGMSVGRLGCLLGGCCAGRPTSARWGLWVTDRRVGMRRVPIQLLESALAASLAITGLLVVVHGAPAPSGVTAVMLIAAYTGLRQLLFPLRAEGRQTIRGRAVTMALAAAAATTAAVIAVAT
jgi:phosphatidylglycerol:prolipoprotein diacylglycerol transferase